jgi:hypothetical protein
VTGPYFVSTVFTSHAENNVEFTMLVPLMNATFMRRLTPPPGGLTTRKTPRHRAAVAGLLAVALALAGCATPGPLHVYSVAAPRGESLIQDRGTAASASVPSFLEDDDTVTGFAYDPYTDHFFLRLAPGNRIRVVDRPARAIKREFTIEGLAADGGADLAARPRDGYLFLLPARGAEVTVTTRFGKLLRTFTLAGVASARAIAVDAVANELWVLHADGRTVSRHRDDGTPLATATLARAIAPSLAADGESRRLYAPLADSGRIGVFGFDGRLLEELELRGRFVDVGPRSFIRVF